MVLITMMKAMITYGLYMDANEAALVDKTEMERVSYQIGYFLRDWIDDVPEELNRSEEHTSELQSPS